MFVEKIVTKMKKSPISERFESEKINISKLNILLQLSGLLAPNIASKIALKMFLTPPNYEKISNKEKILYSTTTPVIYPFSDKLIHSYSWGDGNQTVLLVHGWGGRASHMGSFVKPLVNAGYRVIAFDGPAHGYSGGKQTDMVEFSSAIHWMTETVGPVYAIVAHSFGAGCTLLANKQFGLNVEKMVLIGCFSSAVYITESFGKVFKIQSKIIAKMRKILEIKYNNTWTWESIAPLCIIKNVTIPSLLIHDENDEEVPYEQALELKQAGQNCSLVTTSKLGHRLILRNPSVVKKVVNFVSAE